MAALVTEDGKVVTVMNSSVVPPMLLRDNSTMTKLVLTRTGITRIPEWLFNLTSLEDLSITYAPISELGGISSLFPRRLENVEISHCRIRELPRNLPEYVRNLDLSNNQIDDIDGFADLPGTLRSLILADNRISILPKRFPLRILTKLVLDTNELTSLPSSLPNTLQTLSVNGNYLTELPSRLPLGLRTLHAVGNMITHISLKTLAKCESLTDLVLSYNRIETLSEGFLPRRLIRLYLDNNKLCLGEPLVIPASIRMLNLTSNNINDISYLKFSSDMEFTATYHQNHSDLYYSPRQITRRRIVGVMNNLDEIESFTINISDNQLIRHIPVNVLPRTLVKLDLSHCGLQSLPSGISALPLKILMATDNYLTTINVADLPDSLEILDLSNNSITEISYYMFSRRVRSLKTLKLSYNFLRSIPRDWLFEMTGDLNDLRLNNNNLEEMPSPMPPGVNLLDLSNNNLRSLGNSPFPSSIVLLDLAINSITSLTGPALLGLSNSLRNIMLTGNIIRYIAPEIRRHLENIIDDHQHTMLEHLPPATIYANREIVHVHSVQDSIRTSINNLLEAGVLNMAPSLNAVVDEMVKETRISPHVLRNMFMAAGVIEESSSRIPRTTEDILAIVRESPKVPSQQIFLDDQETIDFSEILRMSWTVIKSHSEREVMIKNMKEELELEEAPPCITGLVGGLISCLAGFDGLASCVRINISTAEQLAAIVESSGRIAEKAEGGYSVEEHRKLARVEMTERGFGEEEILLWTTQIQ